MSSERSKLGFPCMQAALVRFSSFTVRELGRNATYSQADVLDVAWDVDTGGSQVLPRSCISKAWFDAGTAHGICAVHCFALA